MKKTFGVELEFADVYKGSILPDGAVWDYDDNTIVNSNGIANDNKGLLYRYGGEINTRPTDTVREQVDHIEKIIDAVRPSNNYRCNLHVHVGIPGLKDDLSECKRILKYFQENHRKIFQIVERLPMLKEPYGDRLKWEQKRLNRIRVSHQYILPQKRYDAIMAARTPQEFLDEHAPLTDKGRMWHFSPRPAMNMRQLWETETIEFRHFPGTLNLKEIETALLWCMRIVECPEYLDDRYHLDFPKFMPYDFEQEQCYQWLNVANNPRKEVSERLRILSNEVDIYDLEISPKAMYENIIRLCGKHQSFSGSRDNVQAINFA